MAASQWRILLLRRTVERTMRRTLLNFTIHYQTKTTSVNIKNNIIPQIHRQRQLPLLPRLTHRPLLVVRFRGVIRMMMVPRQRLLPLPPLPLLPLLPLLLPLRLLPLPPLLPLFLPLRLLTSTTQQAITPSMKMKKTMVEAVVEAVVEGVETNATNLKARHIDLEPQQQQQQQQQQQ
jgi:hypothetical protein